MRTAAAYHFLGLSTTDYLVDVAHTALENGIYAHGLGEIATMRHPTFAEVGPYFDAALVELELKVTSWEQAVDRVTESVMVSLAEGASNPRDVTSRVYHDFERLTPGSRSLGPLAQFINYFYRYLETYDPYYASDTQLLERLNRECIALARNWCRDRWQPILDPTWLTTTVVALAQGIDNELAFDRLPILADALQDAGCDDADILDHCRGPGPHVRGCWVVDLILRRD